jgi:lipopolysaccharide export LptBFGC system permease protein LptF
MANRQGIDPALVRPGTSELSIWELRRQVQLARTGDRSAPSEALSMELAYHARWVISFAPFVLALFMLSILTDRVVRRWALGLIAFVALFGYYVVMYLGRAFAFAGDLPAVAVWLPNVFFVAVSLALLMLANSRLDHASAG